MATIAICSLLIGSILGIRFRFLVLLPVALLGALLVFASSIAYDSTALQAMWASLVFVTVLQLGYVGTLAFRHFAFPGGVGAPRLWAGSPKLR